MMDCSGIHSAHRAACEAANGTVFWKHDGPAPEYTALVIIGSLVLAAIAWWTGR